LMERASYVGDEGEIGFAHGSEVRLVSERNSAATVTRDGYEITVPKTQLTNDLDVVAAVRSKDATSQARVSAQLAQMRDAARAPSALNRGSYDQREGVARAPQINRTFPAPTPK
ncbi:MAG: hypothetical protein M3429_03860, partial [Verrucomicrobiota bacterium]|nr:hypothetical protein [Verrucomicrobiota bacterium]